MVGARIVASLSSTGLPEVTSVIGIADSTQHVQLTVAGIAGHPAVVSLTVKPNEVWALQNQGDKIVQTLQSAAPFSEPHA